MKKVFIFLVSLRISQGEEKKGNKFKNEDIFTCLLPKINADFMYSKYLLTKNIF